MKRYFSLICMILIIGSCGTTDKLNVLSPTLPEDEVRTRVRELPATKLQSTSQDEKVMQEKKVQEREKALLKEAVVSPKDTSLPDESLVGTDKTQEALINLLEKKGIITKKELSEEIKRLKQMSK